MKASPPEAAATLSGPRGLPASRQEFFVYYRVPQQHADALAEAVRSMQSALVAAHPHLQARLLRRPQSESGQHTWMEAYVAPDGLDVEALAAAIEDAARVLRPWIVGARHVERFLACAW